MWSEAFIKVLPRVGIWHLIRRAALQKQITNVSAIFVVLYLTKLAYEMLAVDLTGGVFLLAKKFLSCACFTGDSLAARNS